MTAIMDIEGIGPVYTGKLKEAGIDTTSELLREGGAASGRANLAKKTGINESKILEWVNHADLMRVKGVGSEYSDLLEAAGVDTVKELAQRNAANLHTRLAEVNTAKNLTNRAPSATEVESWIKQAGEMKAVVTH